MASDTQVDVGSFQAVFRDLRLPIGLLLEEVLLNANGAVLDRDPFRLELSEPGTVEARVSASSLAQFLNQQAPGGLQDFEVKLEEGKVFVWATLRMILEVRAAAVCTLRIHEGRELWVDLHDVEVMGVGAKGMVQGHLDKINPVLDVNEFPIDVVLTEVIVHEDAVVLLGTAAPKAA